MHLIGVKKHGVGIKAQDVVSFRRTATTELKTCMKLEFNMDACNGQLDMSMVNNACKGRGVLSCSSPPDLLDEFDLFSDLYKHLKHELRKRPSIKHAPQA